MQEQYAQLNAILRSVEDAIFMTDAEQRVRYVNPSALSRLKVRVAGASK
jgi:PAS domain S-box-containing protein